MTFRFTPFILAILLAFVLVNHVFAQDGDGNSPHLNSLYEKSASMARVITTGISIAFGVGFLINLTRAQLARGTGDQLGYSRALQQGDRKSVV